MKKRNIIFGTILLLLVVLSVSYAYWTTVIRNNNTPMTLKAEDLKIVFTDTDTINANLIEPGWSYTKRFTVKSETDASYQYSIYIDNLINTFETIGYLQYKITSTNGGLNMTEYKDIPKSKTETNTILESDITITPGSNHEYTIEFIYKLVE